MDKTLTIVIPTYNMERYLDKCLSSLIVDDEKLKSLEVLVINDGSKDCSSQIAHRYEAKYPQTFKVIDKDNGNYGSCVNRGLKEATGKYIKVLDADDYFDRDNFIMFLEFLKRSDADAIISDMKQVDADGNEKLIVNYNLPSDKEFTLGEMDDETIKQMWMHCVCYKTDNIRKINYKQTEGISYTDQEWICLPMSTAKKLAYFHHVVYNYLVGREGQTIDHKIWEKNFWQEIKGAENMIEQQKNIYSGCTEQGKRYINIRIKRRIVTIYTAFFTYFLTLNNNDEMLVFDSKVKEYDENFYHDIEKLTLSHFFPYHFVKSWRHNYDLEKIRNVVAKFKSFKDSVKKRVGIK